MPCNGLTLPQMILTCVNSGQHLQNYYLKALPSSQMQPETEKGTRLGDTQFCSFSPAGTPQCPWHRVARTPAGSPPFSLWHSGTATKAAREKLQKEEVNPRKDGFNKEGSPHICLYIPFESLPDSQIVNAQGLPQGPQQKAAAREMAALRGVQSCHARGIGKHRGLSWKLRSRDHGQGPKADPNQPALTGCETSLRMSS